MQNLDDILNLLIDFRDGNIPPGEFVTRYMKCWRELIKDQDNAIAQHPSAARTLQKLREKLEFTEITPDRYLQSVQEQYALLEGIRLRPGSEASDILDNVFVKADAYRAEADSPNEPYITADELREIVRLALKDLSFG